jgi:hypothetical protein
MNPAETIGTFYSNVFRILGNEQYRSNAIAILLERGGVVLLGMIIAGVGIAFVLANTRAAAAVGDLAGLVITKGATAKAGAVTKAIT